MEQIRTNGEQKELTDEIVDLGTRYGIVTPYTSYLAVEPGAVSETVTVTTDQRSVSNLPMGRPTNGRLGGVGGGGGGGNVARDMPAPPPKEVAKATSGEMAVRQSKRER